MILRVLEIAAQTHFGIMCAQTLYGSGVSLWRRRERDHVAPTPLGISVLKPMHGLDPSLAENLASFAALEPDAPFEVLLLLDDADDAAHPIATAIARAHPDKVRVVVGCTPGFANPKVASLHHGLPHAKHPLLWISDSNTEATPAHLEAIRAAWARTQAAGRVSTLVHAPVSAVRGSGLGARLERLQTATYPNASLAVIQLGGIETAIGKSLLIHRDDLAAVGGFERFASASAEDTMLARAIQERGTLGYATVASRQVLGENLSLRSYFERQRRWARLRASFTPTTFYFTEHFSLFAVAMLLAACGVLPVRWLALGLLGRMFLDALLTRAHVGQWPSPVDLALFPLKEIVQAAAWLGGAFGTQVEWRGRPLRLDGKGEYRRVPGGLPPGPEQPGVGGS